MTINIANVDISTDSFGGWVTRTNQVIFGIKSYAVTTQSNTAPGNAAVSGWFTANVFNVPNTGLIQISTASSNALANATQLMFRTSATSNAIYNANGVSINGGSALLTSTQAKVGSSIINTANVISIDGYFSNVVKVGLTTVNNTIVDTRTSNNIFLKVSNTASFGDSEANVYISRKMLEIYDAPNGLITLPVLVVNSKMTATDLWIQNIHANTIWANTINCNNMSVNTVTSNTYFSGANVTFKSLKIEGNVSITGKGLSFNHSYNGDLNRIYLYNSNTGGIYMARNMYESVLGQDVAANTSGQLLRLVGNALNYYTFTGATAGGTPTLVEEFTASGSGSYFTRSNLGIGIPTNADQRLVVNGAVKMLGSTTGHVILTANASVSSPYTLTLPANTGASGQFLTTEGGSGKTYWVTVPIVNATANLEIWSLGVGTPASGVRGEIRAINNITGYYSSDERLKENITPIVNALAKVKAINGIEFDWTDDYIVDRGGEDGYFIRKHDVGVIAQEIEQIMPEVVVTREDGYKAVKYDRLVALLIEAVKDLSAEVDKLKNGH